MAVKHTELQTEVFWRSIDKELLKLFVKSLPCDQPDEKETWGPFLLHENEEEVDIYGKRLESWLRGLPDADRIAVSKIMYNITALASIRLDGRPITSLIDKDPDFMEAWSAKPYFPVKPFNCATKFWLYNDCGRTDKWKRLEWHIESENISGVVRTYTARGSRIVDDMEDAVECFRIRTQELLRKELNNSKCSVHIDEPDKREPGKFRLLVYYSRFPSYELQCDDEGNWRLGENRSGGMLSIVYIYELGEFKIRSALEASTVRQISDLFNEEILGAGTPKRRFKLILGRTLADGFSFSTGSSGLVKAVRITGFKVNPPTGRVKDLAVSMDGAENFKKQLRQFEDQIGDPAACEVTRIVLDVDFTGELAGVGTVTVKLTPMCKEPATASQRARNVIGDLIENVWCLTDESA